MPFQPAPDCVEVALRYISTTGYIATNVIHFRDDTPPTNVTRLGELLTELGVWASNNWAGAASQDWTLLRIDARSLDAESAPFDSSFPAAEGLVAFDMMSPADTVSMRLNTGLTGRSRRGRLYHVGLAESQVTDGELLSAVATTLIDVYQELYDLCAAIDMYWCVLSRVQDGVTLAEAVPYQISNISVYDFTLDTQRRRRNK